MGNASLCDFRLDYRYRNVNDHYNVNTIFQAFTRQLFQKKVCVQGQ